MSETTQPTLSLELVLDAVKQVLRNKGGDVEAVSPETPLQELGLNSLEIVELFAVLEERSGLELDPESARYRRTVGELTELEVVAD